MQAKQLSETRSCFPESKQTEPQGPQVQPPAGATTQRCAGATPGGRTLTTLEIRPIDTRSLWQAPAPVRFWHLASLDAPTVAVVWSAAFAWAARVRLPAWVLLLQALAVWAVYVADRLLDVRNGHTLRERHLFHWRHRRILAPLAALAACAVGIMMLVLLPATARTPDSVLAAAALVYFSGVHSRLSRLPACFRRISALVPRESLVGILFAAGCALPALSFAPKCPTVPMAAAACFFAALGWLNCHLIERWEAHTNPFRLWTTALACAAAGLLLALVAAPAQPRTGALIFAGSAAALLLALLDLLRPRLTPLTLRAAADLVLLTPLVLLWH